VPIVSAHFRLLQTGNAYTCTVNNVHKKMTVVAIWHQTVPLKQRFALTTDKKVRCGALSQPARVVYQSADFYSGLTGATVATQ